MNQNTQHTPVHKGQKFVIGEKEWETFQRDFGPRWFCRTTDLRFQGYYSVSDIRTAIAKANGGAA